MDCFTCRDKGYVKVGNNIASVHEKCPDCNRDACRYCYDKDDKDCNRCESNN